MTERWLYDDDEAADADEYSVHGDRAIVIKISFKIQNVLVRFMKTVVQ